MRSKKHVFDAIDGFSNGLLVDAEIDFWRLPGFHIQTRFWRFFCAFVNPFFCFSLLLLFLFVSLCKNYFFFLSKPKRKICSLRRGRARHFQCTQCWDIEKKQKNTYIHNLQQFVLAWYTHTVIANRFVVVRENEMQKKKIETSTHNS